MTLIYILIAVAVIVGVCLFANEQGNTCAPCKPATPLAKALPVAPATPAAKKVVRKASAGKRKAK